MEELLRPYGVVIDGHLELGVEVLLSDGVITDVRPHTGIPEGYVLSPAFVNAHSHLEYRGLQGALIERDYWPWIREITLAKAGQDLDQVARDARLAARENVQTGVAAIGEHSDRPVAASALRAAGLQHGIIFQETITRFQPSAVGERLAEVRERAEMQRAHGYPVYVSPHTYQTVDDESLRAFARSGEPLSIHVAETDLENQLTLTGTGAIAETLAQFGVRYVQSGKRVVPTLRDLGLLRPGVQFVHCCAVDGSDIAMLAAGGVTVAHCPRSNEQLRCPPAPLREMLDSGILVGLGMDSPASSGPIDLFAEMRSALDTSVRRRRPVKPEEVWRMATSMGAASLPLTLPEWEIGVGNAPPLLKLHVQSATQVRDLIEGGKPHLVERIV